MKENSKEYIKGFLCVLIVTLTGVGASITIKILVDDILIGNRPEFLWPIQGVFVLLIGIQTFFSIIKSKIYAKASSNIINSLRRKMINKVLNFNQSNLDTQDRGDCLTAFQYDLDGLNDYFMNSVAELIGSIVTIVITMTFMLVLNWKMTLITLPIFPLLILVFNKIQKILDRKNEILQNARKKNVGLLNHIFDCIMTIKLFNCQKYFEEKYDENGNRMQKSIVDLNILYVIMSLASWSMIMVPYQAIMYGIGGTWYFAAGVPTIGLMIAFANYANSLIGPVLSIQRYEQNWSYAVVCVNNIWKILDVSEEKESCSKHINCMEPSYTYSINNVKFSYDKTGNKVFVYDGLSFKNDGINIIYGKSGVGKSTLLKLILGLYVPDEGKITLNGTDISIIDTMDYHSVIAYVPQEISLLENTIYKNMLLANPKASETDMWNIFDMLHMHEEIENLSGGLNAFTGEKGELVSVGQKQRILLAMALLKNSKIIIMDEPSSALDENNTKMLMNLLTSIKETHTIILTSHDHLVLEYADNLLEIK